MVAMQTMWPESEICQPCQFFSEIRLSLQVSLDSPPSLAYGVLCTPQFRHVGSLAFSGRPLRVRKAAESIPVRVWPNNREGDMEDAQNDGDAQSRQARSELKNMRLVQ
jgi:hypothetical protein